MRSASPRLFLALSALPLGCAVFGSAVPRDPVEQARETAATRCRTAATEQARALLDPTLIDGVEPSYVSIRSARTGESARLRGARIRLRPLEGATPEWVSRELECHNARRQLGREAGSPQDPYFLPGVALTFAVETAGDALVVRVETAEVADAQTLLSRARASVP